MLWFLLYKKRSDVVIHEDFSQQYDNTYKHKKPQNKSKILSFHGNKVLVSVLENETVDFPCYEQTKGTKAVYTFLFALDNTDFFLMHTKKVFSLPNFAYRDIDLLKTCLPRHYGFAGMTAYHLHKWYCDHMYCGRCGNPLKQAKETRMLYCDQCSNHIFPIISPAVIVAITNKDKLLMTKYANRPYKKYTLVAGFTEIGESAEDTVHREVMEEVGLRVKNITYYKSQPWGFTGTMLLGFFAELDGDDSITLDERELCEGKWVSREDIGEQNDKLSLTAEMIHYFKSGKKS